MILKNWLDKCQSQMGFKWLWDANECAVMQFKIAMSFRQASRATFEDLRLHEYTSQNICDVRIARIFSSWKIKKPRRGHYYCKPRISLMHLWTGLVVIPLVITTGVYTEIRCLLLIELNHENRPSAWTFPYALGEAQGRQWKIANNMPADG